MDELDKLQALIKLSDGAQLWPSNSGWFLIVEDKYFLDILTKEIKSIISGLRIYFETDDVIKISDYSNLDYLEVWRPIGGIEIKNCPNLSIFAFDHVFDKIVAEDNLYIQEFRGSYNLLQQLSPSLLQSLKQCELIEIDCRKVDLSQLTGLVGLRISNLPTGSELQLPTGLKGLSIDYSAVTTLDISHALGLQIININSSKQLRELHLPSNIEILDISSANLKALEIEHISTLRYIILDDCGIDRLDLSTFEHEIKYVIYSHNAMELTTFDGKIRRFGRQRIRSDEIF